MAILNIIVYAVYHLYILFIHHVNFMLVVELSFTESSQDEEEKKMEPITKKYEKQETAEQKSRRMQSYGYMRLELDKEDWRKCTYHKTRVSFVLFVLC